MKKYEWLPLLFIFIISVFAVFELFINNGLPTTFDGPTHVSDIAGYSLALADGNFPVLWLDKFGNYGMPVGLFSHQLPLTLGGVVDILLHNPVLVYTLLLFLGILLTNITFYFFLRIYFMPLPSVAGLTLLTFSSYRLIDIYIRGDMPEIFCGIFLGLILIGLYHLIIRQKTWAFFLIAFSYCFISLTHPMMLLIYSFFVFPYLFYLFVISKNGTFNNLKIFFSRQHVVQIILFGSTIIVGLSMAAYYLLPLVIEVKYLYFGEEKSHLSHQFLSFANFLNAHWFYFYHNDVATRGQFIQTGGIETLLVASGLLFLMWKIGRQRRHLKVSLGDVAVLSSLVVLFFTTKLSLPIYQHVPFLSDIQFPWRILSIFIFLPPVIVATFLERVNKDILVVAFIFLVLILRFPQVYGKNYVYSAPQSYYFTKYNLFPIDMNTRWTGLTETYPVEKTKIGIITGKGKVVSANIHNDWRKYTIEGMTPLRLVDYTFYFPGWHVYIDGNDTPIQFQDPNYRGVITYMVPSGKHVVEVVFKDTTVRKYAKLLSVAALLFIFLLFLFRKYPMRRLEKYV